MKDDKEDWIENIVNSMKGSQRATPNADLLKKIEHQLDLPESRIIPMYQKRIAVAAAAVLLLLNLIEMRAYLRNSNKQPLVEIESNQRLISNYNLYK